ncbi:MAG: phage major capsid protein [Bacillota bacterium]
MALKQLLKRQQLAAAQTEANNHRNKRAALEERRIALKKREDDATAALEELTAEATPDERKAVEDEANAIDADTATLDSDVEAHDVEQARLDKVVSDLEAEIAELDDRSKNQGDPNKTKPQERGGKETHTMNNRTKFFGMTVEERAAFFANEQVRSFVSSIRESLKTRAVVGGKLTIPDVMLELLRDNIEQYSKLAKYVSVKRVNGTARQNIMGVDPEGIWMEATGEMNELDLALNQVEVDGYMVGGFIPVHDTLLDDSDINLGSEIVAALGKAIGKGVDRAIPYGTGVKMPLGFITRLAQTSKPSNWSSDAPAWTDLHVSNIKKLNINGTSGAAFYAALIEALGIAKPNYSNGQAFWIMNRTTHINLMTKALAFDAAAALIAGVNNQMPIIGGDIVELEIMGDYEIAGGFGSVFTLAERAGAEITSSEHVRFLKNQTVFKGYARYDGLPVFGEAFVVVSYDNTDAATSSTFPVDYANTELGVLGVTAVAGTATGDTVLTVTGAESSGTSLKYKLGDFAVKRGDKVTGYTALVSGTTQITAAAGKMITVVELDGDSRVIKSGKVFAVPKA